MIERNHPPIKYGNTGVLIINLGTPDSTKWFDIRKYLKEFLSDRRVIEVNPLVWQIILNLFILNFRPSKTAKAYKEIWMKDENMSPLLYYTEKQSEKVSKVLSKENLKKEASYYLKIFKDHPYIFNLGHGILPETNPVMVENLIKIVRDFK